jgi:RsiW-degrading membrane proteinase PrsW (M82 family)
MGLLALAIAPCIAIMVYIYIRDEYEKEPLWLLALSFAGGMLSVIPAILLEKWGQSLGFHSNGNLYNTAVFAFIVVGFSEEFSKYLFLRFIPYRNKEFNEPYDGIMYSVVVSMGFATVENIMYVSQYGAETGIMRMFTAIPAHAVFGIIMGYFVGKAKFSGDNSFFLHIFGIIMAVAFHGAYDFSLMQNEIPGLKLVGALVSLVVAIRLSSNALTRHKNSSPFK